MKNWVLRHRIFFKLRKNILFLFRIPMTSKEKIRNTSRVALATTKKDIWLDYEDNL